MPTFCRHNRFIERCSICSQTLPDYAQPGKGSGGRAGGAGGSDRGSAGGKSATAGQGKRSGSASGGRRSAARRPRAANMRVYADGRKRETDDGYRCELLPGLRSSEDARRLLEEIAFVSARLQALALSPPGAYATAAKLGGEGDMEEASLLCFLIAYLCPLDGDEPFAAILAAPSPEQDPDTQDERVETLPLGPRTCHQPGRGAATLRAYLAWAERAGSQRQALTGELPWSPERRFERIFERLAIPGFPRWGRYELLVLLGRLGLYELRADSLHLPSALAGDPVLVAAKRAFAIGDPILLERRARGLSEEIAVPLEALELALFNWFSPQRATVGFPEQLRDDGAIERGERALGL